MKFPERTAHGILGATSKTNIEISKFESSVFFEQETTEETESPVIQTRESLFLEQTFLLVLVVVLDTEHARTRRRTIYFWLRPKAAPSQNK